MDVRLIGYDDYVKEFEEIRKNPDVQPWSEDELTEAVEIMLEAAGDCSLEHYLEAEYASDGQDHDFIFSFEPVEKGCFCISYVEEVLA